MTPAAVMPGGLEDVRADDRHGVRERAGAATVVDVDARNLRNCSKRLQLGRRRHVGAERGHGLQTIVDLDRVRQGGDDPILDGLGLAPELGDVRARLVTVEHHEHVDEAVRLELLGRRCPHPPEHPRPGPRCLRRLRTARALPRTTAAHSTTTIPAASLTPLRSPRTASLPLDRAHTSRVPGRRVKNRPLRARASRVASLDGHAWSSASIST